MAKKVETQKNRNASPAEISHAETLYCEKKWSPEAIAEALGRNIKTVYGWRDKGHWDETRDLFDTGPTELKKMLLKEATRITKGEVRKDNAGNEIPGIDADSLSKVMKAYDYMCKQASPAVCRDVLMEFDNWLSSKEAKLASDMTQYHKMFLIYKIQLENGN